MPCVSDGNGDVARIGQQHQWGKLLQTWQQSSACFETPTHSSLTLTWQQLAHVPGPQVLSPAPRRGKVFRGQS